jgi:hypothetical protein
MKVVVRRIIAPLGSCDVPPLRKFPALAETGLPRQPHAPPPAGNADFFEELGKLERPLIGNFS